MTTEIELRLTTAGPTGEIAAGDLVALAGALQELLIRITREVVNAARPGRSKQFIEELSELRLRAVEVGSTVLRFSKGPIGNPDTAVEEAALADDRFWDAVRAIAKDHRPDWMSDRVAASVVRLIDAIRAAAPTVVIAGASRGEVHIDAAATHRETWTPQRVSSGSMMTFAGILEKVDLNSREFRLRDAVGNTVALRHVEKHTAAAQRIGQWVTAEGAGVLHAAGRLVALDDARVLDLADPAADYLGHRVVSLEEVLASAPGPDPDDGIDLTEEEALAFLQILRS